MHCSQLIQCQLSRMLIANDLTNESRRLADNHEKSPEVMEVAHGIMANVHFAVAGEHLHPMGFIETFDTLQC